MQTDFLTILLRENNNQHILKVPRTKSNFWILCDKLNPQSQSVKQKCKASQAYVYQIFNVLLNCLLL